MKENPREGERLYHSGQYTKKAETQQIKSCSSSDTTKGYNAAMKLRQQECGYEFLVIEHISVRSRIGQPSKGRMSGLMWNSVILIIPHSCIDKCTQLP